MQKKRPDIQSGIMIFIFVLVLGFGIPAHSQEKPYKLLGYAVLPDITKTLDTIEKIAIETDPVNFMPNMLKMQAGMFIGDPALQNIDHARPVLVMLFYRGRNEANMKKESPRIAIFIPVKNSDIAGKMIPKIKFPSMQIDNLIIVSDFQPIIPHAKNEIPLYREIAEKQLKCDVRLMVKINNITETFNTELNELLKKMQTSMEKKELLPFKSNEAGNLTITAAKVFMYGIFDIIQQSKDYQLDITLNESMIAFESEHSAVRDTALYSFFDASAPDKNKCLSLLPGSGLLVYAGYFDVKKTKLFIESILAEAVGRDPGLQKNLEEGFISAYLKSLDLYLGEIALQYGLLDDGKIQLNIAYSTDKTEKDFLALQNSFTKIYSAIYSNPASGFKEYTFQENVRSYKGVNIHRTSLKTNFPKDTQTGKTNIITKMFGDEMMTEYAVTRGFILASTDQKTLDKIIDNTLSGGSDITLEAMKSFGPGMDSYTDIKIIDLIEQVIKTMTPQIINGDMEDKTGSMPQMFAGLSREERLILASGKYSNGVSYSKYKVSTRMITELLKYFNKSKRDTEFNQSEGVVE